MTRANFTEAFEAHQIKRIERHEPTSELPYVWYAVELLPDSRFIGTGRTVAEAFSAAGALRRKLLESVAA